jgi:hypothetical protein
MHAGRSGSTRYPAYAAQRWLCALNPSHATFDTIRPLLAEAHATAQWRFNGRRAGKAAVKAAEA